MDCNPEVWPWTDAGAGRGVQPAGQRQKASPVWARGSPAEKWHRADPPGFWGAPPPPRTVEAGAAPEGAAGLIWTRKAELTAQ